MLECNFKKCLRDCILFCFYCIFIYLVVVPLSGSCKLSEDILCLEVL